jgi:hypothetical protein
MFKIEYFISQNSLVSLTEPSLHPTQTHLMK